MGTTLFFTLEVALNRRNDGALCPLCHRRLHLMGLTSDGGVHSSIDHLFKLIDIAKMYNIENCYVHCFMDGRDTDPMSGKGFVIDLQTIPNLQYYCMTPYDDSFTGIHVIFPKGNVENTLGEYIASKGLKQLHAAETEKYAHVTSFINDDGTPNTAHSTNPVPFIYVTANSNARVQNGVLADVAPTILHIMGLGQPQEMTGQCLINK